MKTITDRLCHDIFTSVRRDIGDMPCILAEEEKNLLIESLPSGQFIIFESYRFGSHLATADKHWFSEKDKSHQKTILRAFKLLCRRGYVRHMKLDLFKLSRHGLEAALRHWDESQQEFYENDAA
jgi:hypothetical protein